MTGSSPLTGLGPWSMSLAELVTMAREQPHIADEDPRSASLSTGSRPTPAFGNMWRRFRQVRDVSRGTGTDDDVRHLRMIKERFGLDLIAYARERSETCRQIFEVLEAKHTYDVLVDVYDELRDLEAAGVIANGTARTFEMAPPHRLGLSATGLYHVDRLDPLLAMVHADLGRLTLNVPFLVR